MRQSHPGSLRLSVLLLVAAGVPALALAAHVRVPIVLEHGFLEMLLREQVFSGPGGRVRLNDDGTGCQYLELWEPRIGASGGDLRLRTRAAARAGRRVGSQCLMMLNWAGQLEFVQRPEIDADRRAISLRTISWRALRADGGSAPLSDIVAGWLDRYLPAELRRTPISLAQPLDELASFLALVVNEDAGGRLVQMLDSLGIDEVVAGDDRVTVTFGMETLPLPVTSAAEVPALTADELARLEAHLDTVDDFFTYAIRSVGADGAVSEPDALLEVLVELRRDLVAILAGAGTGPVDPARQLFVRAWDGLAPLLRAAASQQADRQRALDYLTFIGAGDALRALDALGPAAGIDISSDGLRRLARMLVPEAKADPLQRSESVDPELRRAFGFGDPIPPPEVFVESSWLQWFIPAAVAASGLDPAAVKKLNGWVPRPQDMDTYLPMVRDVLRQVVNERIASTRLEAAYHRPFGWLVFAAAWQESCWRQFVARNDMRVPMESGSGDIGMMQINPKVWRGFYDLHGLRWDLVYNARAGADILAHHLLNYGVRKREHQVTGSVDSVARAAYAAYNGGPRQYDRYRRADASARERKVDSLFLAKYREVKNGGELGVKACYGR